MNFRNKQEMSSSSNTFPRFYHQPILHLDSSLHYHLINQQNRTIASEITSFPPFSPEVHRLLTQYNHQQFPSRIDPQTPVPSNELLMNLMPPPTVPVMTHEENSNGSRYLSELPHPVLNSLSLPCQNYPVNNTNHFPVENPRLPHNICNLGIINSEQSNMQQLDNSKSSSESLTKDCDKEKKLCNDKPPQTDGINHSEDSIESDNYVAIKQNRVVFCKVCRKGYGSQESLKIHMLSHGPHKCPMCNKVFSRQCSLKIHMAVHAERTCLCKDCGKSFKSANALHAHSNTVHANSDLNSVICESCGIVLKNRKSLLQHEQIHVRGKRFACDLCDERFHRKDALNRHVVRIHVEERFFTCQVCKTHFNTNEGLQEHLWTHEAERPHQCQQCQRRFAQRSALERHVKIHSSQHPFSCGICGLSFTRSYRLKAHLQSHLGT